MVQEDEKSEAYRLADENGDFGFTADGSMLRPVFAAMSCQLMAGDTLEASSFKTALATFKKRLSPVDTTYFVVGMLERVADKAVNAGRHIKVTCA